jgi:hypothetical protein
MKKSFRSLFRLKNVVYNHRAKIFYLLYLDWYYQLQELFYLLLLKQMRIIGIYIVYGIYLWQFRFYFFFRRKSVSRISMELLKMKG